MTPLEIELLLHIHCKAEPIRNETAPKMVETLRAWVDRGIIREIPMQGNNLCPYTTTDFGHAMVEMLCAVPLPIHAFMDPRDNRLIMSSPVLVGEEAS